MKQETKDKLKSFGKGVWGVLKFAFDVLTYDSEEEEKKERQKKEELERMQREQEERRRAYEQAQQEKAEREALAAKYGSMSKQESIVAALENHDKIKKLESENASLRRSNANLRSEIEDLEHDNQELNRSNEEQSREIEDLEDKVKEYED